MITLKTIKLTDSESKILSIIKTHGTPVTTKEIKQVTGLEVRAIRDNVVSLRLKGIPVISGHIGINKGYSIAKDEAQRAKCVAMLSNQATTMMKNINGLANADLKNWDKHIKVM